MGRAREYVDSLAAAGRRHFTSEEVVGALGASAATVRASLRRLKATREIAEPQRGFYVIVPPEHRRDRCIPPDQFIAQLMVWLGHTYYVALLSAAEIHGVPREAPGAFQVMLSTTRRAVACGAAHVQFIARKDLRRTATVEKMTPYGALRVASRAATALELVGYADHCGGLERAGEVVAQLSESVDLDELVSAAGSCPTAWVQRLGYLLDLCGCQEVADALVSLVRARARATTRLLRSRPTRGARRVARWHLVVNARLEPQP